LSHPRSRTWLAVAALVALLGGALLLRPRRADTPDRPPPTRAGEGPATVAPLSRLTLGASDAASPVDAPGRALDCAHPSGDAARIDAEAIPAERVCARLSRLGGVVAAGVDRRQARLVLDQLIDVALVRRALAFERAGVSESELAAALAALPGAVADAAVDPLLNEQMRERLELRKLAGLRSRLEVSDGEVDAEVAAGAPGIDRGQGVRVEAWIARMTPGVDAGEHPAAQQAAEGFAAAVATQSPEAAAAQHHMAHLAPFVLGANGVEPELERAAFGLSEGQWSGAVRTRVGWAVLRVIGRSEGQAMTTDALRALVRRALESRRLQAAQAELLASLRAAARVEVLVDL